MACRNTGSKALLGPFMGQASISLAHTDQQLVH